MASRRILPIATIALGSLALSGCVIAPPQLPPETSPGSTTQPPPSATASPSSSPSAPATSEPDDPEPSSTEEPVQTGSTVTIDGQPVDSWGGTVLCVVFGTTALLSSSPDDPSGTLFGLGSNETGAWQSTGFAITDGSDSYFQQDEAAPATYDGTTYTTEFVATPLLSGGSVTVSISTPC